MNFKSEQAFLPPKCTLPRQVRVKHHRMLLCFPNCDCDAILTNTVTAAHASQAAPQAAEAAPAKEAEKKEVKDNKYVAGRLRIVLYKAWSTR